MNSRTQGLSTKIDCFFGNCTELYFTISSMHTPVCQKSTYKWCRNRAWSRLWDFYKQIPLYTGPGLHLPRLLFLFPSAYYSFIFCYKANFAGLLHSAVQVVLCIILGAPFTANVIVQKPTELLITVSRCLHGCKLNLSVKEAQTVLPAVSYSLGWENLFLLEDRSNQKILNGGLLSLLCSFQK